MKICSVVAELFRVGRRTDRLNEANSRLSLFCETPKKLDDEKNSKLNVAKFSNFV